MSERDVSSLQEKAVRIRKLIRWYLLGCVGFVLLAGLFIWLGVLIIQGKDLPRGFILLSIGGIWLLWDMVKSWNHRTALPKNFTKVARGDIPQLFSLVDAVTMDLGVKTIPCLYLCPEAFAAVFIRPSLKNVFSKHSKLDLVLGLGFLTQLTDKQLKTILYHEFGHYCQDSIRETGAVYRIAQFSKMFLADRKEYSGSSLGNQMKAQIALFANYTMVFAGNINTEYRVLSRLMEYEADDIAARHMGGAMVRETIRRASTVKNAYEAIHWGMGLLPANSFIDNEYEALSIISGCEELLAEVKDEYQRRIERLSDDLVDTSPDSYTVKTAALPWAKKISTPVDTKPYPAAAFANWLVKGLPIYRREAQRKSSVTLYIHLAPYKHKFPLLDSRYQILLDEQMVGTGNFKAGYTIKVRTAPGNHLLSVYCPAGVKTVPFDFNAEEDKNYLIEMDYKLERKNGVYEIFATSIVTMTDSSPNQTL